ncbi:MAG: TIGR03915 family putative DNA repair protein [Brachymonas sp.]|nr:TIGR03915 family putative DNA repair protein [Brachymonas sp.]
MRFTLQYDGSFDGLLSAVFHAYAHKYPLDEVHISCDAGDSDLFGQNETVATNPEHAQRVFQRLEQQIGRRGTVKLLYGFLSAAPEMPDTFLRIVRLALAQPQRADILIDYGHFDVMQWAQWVKSVSHEKHRMEGFVRFAEMENGMYFARIEPLYDVLPLIIRHFCQRFPAQQWAIYDMQRGYGVFHHSGGLHRISDLEESGLEASYSAHERAYQQLWQRYFRSATIASRCNPRLHRQQMPQRYWKYLTEKKPLPPQSAQQAGLDA